MKKIVQPRVVLQEKLSQQYLQENNEWTTEFDAARNFREVPRAFEFARKHQLENLDIIISLDGRRRHSIAIAPDTRPMAARGIQL